MITNLPDPNERDLYEKVFRDRTKGLTDRQILAIVDYAFTELNPTGAGVLRHMAKHDPDAKTPSKPSGQRYRDMILSCRERGAQAVLSAGKGSVADRPTPETKARAQRAAGENAAITRANLQREANRLSAEDMSQMVDELLRRERAAPQPNLTAIKSLMEFKLKFEGLSNQGKERIIDPMKVLGERGLANAGDRFVKNTELVALHRHEIPEVWRGAVRCILSTLTEDLLATEEWPGYNPETAMREFLFALDTLELGISAESSEQGAASSTSTPSPGDSEPVVNTGTSGE